jgi:hypothetical protein
MRQPPSFAALVALASLGSAACQAKPSPGATPAASVAAPAPSEPPAAPPRVRAARAEDLDLAVARSELGCENKAKAKGREAAASSRIRPRRALGGQDCRRGAGAWFGHAFVVTKGVETREFLLVRARRVPTAQVGPSDLPLMFGTGGLPRTGTSTRRSSSGR